MKLGETVRHIQRRWPTASSRAEESPVFILAAGWRSGSTLLQRMLLHKCLIWGEPYGAGGIIARLAQPLCLVSDEWPEETAFIDKPWWGQQSLGTMWTANLYPPIQCLLDAHVEFFRKLLAEPSHARGFTRWGLKEVRYGMDHAVYLRWLFPKAKFLFLVRNPYESWASYSGIEADWVRFYPEPPVSTPEEFGRHWVSIVESCLDGFEQVDGFPIRFEHLASENYDLRPLTTYLGFEPDRGARTTRVGGALAFKTDPAEMERLDRVVQPTAERLGYKNPFSARQ